MERSLLYWWRVMDQLLEEVVVVMVWVVSGLSCVVDVVDVVVVVEVGVAMWDVCGHRIGLAASHEVDAVAECQ